MGTLRKRLDSVEERIAIQQYRELQRQFQGRSCDEKSFFIIHGYWPENAGDILPHRLEFTVRGIIAGGTVQDKSGNFQEAKDKRFCVPEGLTSGAMELTVKMKMGADLAVYPEDRDMPAVSYVTAVIAKQFPCQKTK